MSSMQAVRIDVATRIDVLGSLRAYDGEARVDLGGSKQQAVLARLIVAFPGSVDASELANAAWPGVRPRSYNSSLQAYLSRLRKVLGDGVINHDREGYRLHLDGAQADWLRFVEAVDLGGRAVAAHRYAEAVNILEP